MSKGSDSTKSLVFISLFVAAASLAVALFGFFQRKEIVYVDTQRLTNGYKGMKAARDEFELRTKAWKLNLDSLQQELTKQIKNYEKKRTHLSAQEQRLTEELIQTKQREFLSYQKAVQEKMQEADEELSRKVTEKINAYVRRYGERKGYVIILAAMSYGNIAYARADKDITDEILNGINAEFLK